MSFISTPALAQDACSVVLKQAYTCAINGDFKLGDLSSASLMGFASVALMASAIGLRLLAEVLGWIADRTKNTWDNKLVHNLMNAVNFLAKVIGWFGAGKPRLVK